MIKNLVRRLLRRGSADAAMTASRPIGKHLTSFRINGRDREAFIEPHMLLIDVIREKLGLTGAKRACATGHCGACTVLIDGVPIRACITLAVTATGRSITTVEGLAQPDGTWHPLQQAFVDCAAAQCGFCTSGMLVTAAALLAENPKPTRDDVRRALSGNLCRCTGYVKIADAVLSAANTQASHAAGARA